MDATQLKNFIGGQFVPSQSADWGKTLNPSKPQHVLAMIPCGDAADVEAAVSTAAESQKAWAKLSGPARSEALYKWADAIQARSADLANAVVAEVGKPIGEARGEVGRCVAILRYYAGEAVRSVGEVVPAQVGGSLQYSLRQPLGVVGLITPWNFPLAIPLWKAAPALAVGNTVVMKPAEQSSYTASLLAETAAAAGLPAGVFNVIFGKGSRIGGALMGHKDIRAISFTGSDAVGEVVAKTCAARNIKYQTEMGGKNVGIVLKDADLKQAANLVASGAFRFAGQKCTATSRVVVEKAVKEAFLKELIDATNALSMIDPAEATSALGPVISSDSKNDLYKAINAATAEKVLGPDANMTGEFAEGYFVSPTLFTGVDIESPLAQEELFGPVLAMLDAEDYEHAIALANNSKFGLSAAVYTKDIPSALKYIDQIEAGLVRVNGDTTGVDPHSPFGGFKGSSSHVREQGSVAKEFYTEYKTVQINP